MKLHVFCAGEEINLHLDNKIKRYMEILKIKKSVYHLEIVELSGNNFIVDLPTAPLKMT